MSASISTKGTVKFLTLGCRLNQYETQAMRERLALDGYREAVSGETVDVFVINTCTVTADADRDSRYLIRKCHRENPNAKVVVTGCYAEKDYKQIQKIEGVSHILLNRQKSDVARLLDSCTQLTFKDEDYTLRSKSDFVPLEISKFSGKKRAYIKVQDGCNHACSFCKVVLVRGKSRSREVESVLEEANRLSQNGYLEIVLTGIQLGAYGLDFERKRNLCNLIQELLNLNSGMRIRLSSIEPTDVTDELIDLMSGNSSICPHLHIPLQSGSNKVLTAMNRRYGNHFYLELVSRLKNCVPDFVLTTDVMVGFPGEEDSDFQNTIDTLLSTKPLKIHTFPYSLREGTRAFGMKLVESQIIAQRMEVLNRLEEELRCEVQREYIGRTLNVLIEGNERDLDFEGHAHNFLLVRVQSHPNLSPNRMVAVQIEEMKSNVLFGNVPSLISKAKGYSHGVSHGHY